MPAPTNPPTPSAASAIPPPSHHSTLPPPSTFDFLPPLYALLNRLVLSPNTTSSSTLPETGPSSTTPQPNQSDQSNQTHPTQPNHSNSVHSDNQPLYPKDLITAASAITAKIQKAKVAVREIEGIELGLEEQEEWIKELEAEVERGRGVLEALTRACREEMEGEDVKMDVDGEMDG